ncbi:MAG: hypothetical protein WA783_22100 [Phormidesmis sp.]
MLPPVPRTWQKFWFLLFLIVVYSILIIQLDFLRAPAIRDEQHFWETALTFSDRLLPTLNDLRDYEQLSTPLPFIIFGALEYLFNQGLLAGRLLNIVLSITIVFIVGWPTAQKQGRALSCLIGLVLCPDYIFYSRLMYTDIIACFFGLLGVISYVHNRHLLSSLAFVLAIATRQYMLAFPAATLTYEFAVYAIQAIRSRRFTLSKAWVWLSPLLASLTIFGWFLLFQGLAPQSAIEVRTTPDVQQTLWALVPGHAINFLGFVGMYIVLPELMLFRSSSILQRWRQRPKVWIIVAVLLAAVLVFPPIFVGPGTVFKLVNLLPYTVLKMSLLYGLALLTCIRFSQLNMMSLFVLFNSLIMMKAYPWDKYILPLVVVFWYLKSVGLEDKFSLSDYKSR